MSSDSEDDEIEVVKWELKVKIGVKVKMCEWKMESVRDKVRRYLTAQ